MQTQYTCIKVINIISFICLILSEITSIVSCSLFFNATKETVDVEINNIISIVIAVAGIIIIITTGLYSWYLRKVYSLLIYIILAFLLCAFKIYFALMLIFRDTKPLNVKVLVITKLISAAFYFITAICIGILRSHINNEIEQAPLTLINDGLITEDMYNNMLDQSKDPNNKKLKEEFAKMYNDNNNNNNNNLQINGDKLFGSANSSLRDDSYAEKAKN